MVMLLVVPSLCLCMFVCVCAFSCDGGLCVCVCGRRNVCEKKGDRERLILLHHGNLLDGCVFLRFFNA